LCLSRAEFCEIALAAAAAAAACVEKTLDYCSIGVPKRSIVPYRTVHTATAGSSS
jgi:hypothetical protein